jgi:predicted metalloprotease with PDZ domain
MFFRGNELKVLLKIKELTFSGVKNELVFERKMHPFMRAKSGKEMRLNNVLRPGWKAEPSSLPSGGGRVGVGRKAGGFPQVGAAEPRPALALAANPDSSGPRSPLQNKQNLHGLPRNSPTLVQWRTGHGPVFPAIDNRQLAIGNRCAALILACVFLLPLLASSSFAASEPIQYLLDLREPASHLAKVEMTVAGASPSTEIQFPAWNNLYQIRDFARYIEGLTADCDGGKEQLTRVDLNTWRTEAKSCGKLSLRYTVYVVGSPPFSSGLDAQHAFLNFATLLFYLPQERGRPVHVKLLVPAGWKVASLLEEDADGFPAANYDLLVDSPVEAGEFQEYRYAQDGATYRVVVHADPQDYSPDRLLASLSKITASETALMRDVPFSRYTFILHFPREEGGGGMEHRNGTAITVRAKQLRDHWEGLEGVAAHEFFHLWNVKRIRPQSLEPIDYVHGNDTRDLWFCEGVTSTYGELTLVRAGLTPRKAFYARLGSAITTLQSKPARLFQSVEESGLEAWFEKYGDYFRPERSISYYNKGELLGFLLDLALRHATGNAAGLDDVMRRLNEDFARHGRYYTESDLRRVIAGIAPGFSGLEAFFADYVRGTQELDYVTYLSYCGLELEVRGPGSARLGFEASVDSAGQVRVDYVEPRSPAAQAGLAQGDILQAINDQELRASPAALLPQLKPGQEMKLEVLRGGSALKLEYRLETNAGATYRVKEMAHPSPEQLQVREGWLQGDTTPEQHRAE